MIQDKDGLGDADCPYCGGFGYILPDVPPTHPSFGKSIVCQCRAKNLKKEHLNKLLTLSEIGQLRNSTFENFATDVANLPGFSGIGEKNLKNAYDHALAFAKSPTGWLIFKGRYGCGKTHLAAAIANYRLDLGDPVLFISTPDLLDYLRAAYSNNSNISFDERFEQVKNASLLILDDLGTENSTLWAREKLYQIFDYRYRTKLPTIITTNQDLESIDPRIRSRLIDKNLAKIILIIAPDFRRPEDYQEQSDLSTLYLHKEQTLANFSTRERELPHNMVQHLHRVLEAAHKFAENPAEGSIRWMVFNSIEYGNGKTHLAAAIANYRVLAGDEVLFVLVPDLLDYLRAAFDPSSRVGLDRRFNEVKKVSFLVLDDLGTESATAWAREKLYQLINYRYNARLPTVVTTSTPILELDQRISTRLFDDHICDFWTIEVPPYRGLPEHYVKESIDKNKNVKKQSSISGRRRNKF